MDSSKFATADGRNVKAQLLSIMVVICAILPAHADETPPHTVAVMGEAEMFLPPDYATMELGVITQGPAAADALAESNARMSKVVDAIRRLGVADAGIHTSNFTVEPKYEKDSSNGYDPESLRPVVGSLIANKVTITVTDMSKIAAIIDASVQAGANASGRVNFQVKNPTKQMDVARQAAIENAEHKARVLTEAAHVNIGRVISITDNGAERQYNNQAGGNLVETVVVTGSRNPETPILPGQISVTDQVTVIYAVN